MGDFSKLGRLLTCDRRGKKDGRVAAESTERPLDGSFAKEIIRDFLVEDGRPKVPFRCIYFAYPEDGAFQAFHPEHHWFVCPEERISPQDKRARTVFAIYEKTSSREQSTLSDVPCVSTFIETKQLFCAELDDEMRPIVDSLRPFLWSRDVYKLATFEDAHAAAIYIWRKYGNWNPNEDIQISKIQTWILEHDVQTGTCRKAKPDSDNRPVYLSVATSRRKEFFEEILDLLMMLSKWT